MRQSWWMLAASALSAIVIMAFLGDGATPNLRLSIFLGMAGPLAASVCAMVSATSAYRRDPVSLTGALIKAFVAKLVFFGGYVALVVKAGWVDPVPFAISLTGYFVLLHMIEAFRLRRLFKQTQ